MELNGSDIFAAVDLGSNSFHMKIARAVGHRLETLDKLRERVRLAAGLDAEKNLGKGAQDLALVTLKKFGERLKNIPPTHVRAVGTNTFRRARNSRSFIRKAERVLGHPIDVISGYEEARLIYLGIAHSHSDETQRRLVVDIGGGSTECIIGEGFETLRMASLYMGCISYSAEFFPGGRIDAKNFRRAEIAAGTELETIVRDFNQTGWRTAVGCSGTVLAVESILLQNGWSKRAITRKGIRKLRRVLLQAGTVKKLAKMALPGLQEDRVPVLAGGLAILSTLMEGFEIQTLFAGNASLREGVLHDLVGRHLHEDVRERSVRQIGAEYHVDQEQAGRVGATALYGLEQVREAWGLDRQEHRRLLDWAAQLHEIGLAMSYSGYHKHGQYVLANSIMPGFSRNEQQLLATLIRGHRRRISRSLFDNHSSAQGTVALRLCVLLRLAVLLNRSRSPRPLPNLTLLASRNALRIRFEPGWLNRHPLTRADLETESRYLKRLGMTVSFH